jgi:hypothetical protein
MQSAFIKDEMSTQWTAPNTLSSPPANRRFESTQRLSVKSIKYIAILSIFLSSKIASAQTSDTWRDYLKGKLSISTHLAFHRLLDNSRPEDPFRQETFLGYINELNVVDDPQFILGLRYRVVSPVFIELTHDRFVARTMNFNNNLSDGNVVLDGPMLLVGIDHAVSDRWWLVAGLGIGFWSGSFEHDAWWTWGWASPDAYDRAGSPSYSPTGNRRIISVDDETSLVYLAGVNYQAFDNLGFELNLRYTEIEVRNQFFGGTVENPIPGAEGYFTLDNTALCIGMRYRF